VVTATEVIVQRYCVLCAVNFGYINTRYSAMFCAVCGLHCVYNNGRYSAKLMCRVLSLLWLEQQ